MNYDLIIPDGDWPSSAKAEGFPTCPTVVEQFLDIKRTSINVMATLGQFPLFVAIAIAYLVG